MGAAEAQAGCRVQGTGAVVHKAGASSAAWIRRLKRNAVPERDRPLGEPRNRSAEQHEEKNQFFHNLVEGICATLAEPGLIVNQKTTETGGFELYKESAEFTYRMPVRFDELKAAAQLLSIKLPENDLANQVFEEPNFVNALIRSSPPAHETTVSKRRSQYQCGDGWIELADVEFETREVQSISVHAQRIDDVRGMLENLRLGDELETMNYIEACRRWG